MKRTIHLKESELKQMIRETIKLKINEANPFPQPSHNSVGRNIKNGLNLLRNINGLDAQFGGFIRLIHDVEDSIKENRNDEALYQLERLENILNDFRGKYLQ